MPKVREGIDGPATRQQIAKLRAEIERLREEKRGWMKLADQRAIESLSGCNGP
jgi:hypothetical protein